MNKIDNGNFNLKYYTIIRMIKNITNVLYNNIKNIYSYLLPYENDIILSKCKSFIIQQKDIKTMEDWYLMSFHSAETYIPKNIDYKSCQHIDKIMLYNQIKNKYKTTNLTLYATKADLIICNQVLEHDKNWKKILDNFFNSFDKFGILVITIPFNKSVDDKVVYINKYQNEHFNNIKIAISISYSSFFNIIYSYKNITYEIENINNGNNSDIFIYYFKKKF
mgnify:CR=1 FL=1